MEGSASGRTVFQARGWGRAPWARSCRESGGGSRLETPDSAPPSTARLVSARISCASSRTRPHCASGGRAGLEGGSANAQGLGPPQQARFCLSLGHERCRRPHLVPRALLFRVMNNLMTPVGIDCCS